MYAPKRTRQFLRIVAIVYFIEFIGTKGAFIQVADIFALPLARALLYNVRIKKWVYVYS